MDTPGGATVDTPFFVTVDPPDCGPTFFATMDPPKKKIFVFSLSDDLNLTANSQSRDRSKKYINYHWSCSEPAIVKKSHVILYMYFLRPRFGTN